MATFKVYRETTLGVTLQTCLDSLSYEVRSVLASKVMDKFDEVICAKFREFNQNTKIKLNGKCRSYNNCDDVWVFRLEQCGLKGDNIEMSTNEPLKIIAIDAGLQREGEPRRAHPKKKAKGGQKRNSRK